VSYATAFVINGLIVRTDQPQKDGQVGRGRVRPQTHLFEVGPKLVMQLRTVLAANAIASPDERRRCASTFSAIYESLRL
jgi:hypothetical protein